jgi:thiamine biosynthesis protein ThiC
MNATNSDREFAMEQVANAMRIKALKDAVRDKLNTLWRAGEFAGISTDHDDLQTLIEGMGDATARLLRETGDRLGEFVEPTGYEDSAQ